MSLKVATLKDGSQVAQLALFTTTLNLKAVMQENVIVLSELVEKCKDANYQFVATFGVGSKAILTKHALMNEREEVHDDIQKIVLNSIEGSGLNLRLVSPLQSRQVQNIK